MSVSPFPHQTIARRSRAALVSLVMLAVLSLMASSPVAAQDTPADETLIRFDGHGWGHGRGLGQYGALGYARQGWTSVQILNHYYGGTTAGILADAAPPLDERIAPIDPAALRVEIRGNRDRSACVSIGDGIMGVKDAAGTELDPVPPGTFIRLVLRGEGVALQVGTSCSSDPDDWTDAYETLTASLSIRPVTTAGGIAGDLRLGSTDGSGTWFPGTLTFENVGGSERTVNVVSVEQYLQGVVPNEVPASWDAAALEAQSVAARSYVLAGDVRQQPYADTCDTTLCQVYRGTFRQSSNGQITPSTHGSTNAALAATEGVLRIRDDNGTVARTEFSSSTGGWTVEFDFPAVEDLGDAVEDNPNHNWTTVYDATDWVASRELGALLDVQEIERDGNGADGGRVIMARFVFEEGNLDFTGDEVRRAFGLKSSWFSASLTSGLSPENEAYVEALHQLFLGRTAEPAELRQAVGTLARDGRYGVANELSVSDEWAGRQIDLLYQTALGRASDVGGRAFWLSRVAAGLRISEVGVDLYGSPEYYERSGGTDASFIDALYRDLLGRPADQGGVDFWLARMDDEGLAAWQVTQNFYASPESRGDRVTQIYDQVLGRQPDAGGLAFWSEQLLTIDDVRLAADLAISDEYFTRTQDAATQDPTTQGASD